MGTPEEAGMAKEIRVLYGVGGFTCLHPSLNLTEYREVGLCPVLP